jgi:hypothetical protein
LSAVRLSVRSASAWTLVSVVLTGGVGAVAREAGVVAFCEEGAFVCAANAASLKEIAPARTARARTTMPGAPHHGLI